METLRPLIQPITHNLPPAVRDLGTNLIGESCYQSLILDLDHTDHACLKLATSRGLGFGIVAASAVVKVPQIIKLSSSRSAAGVSFLAYALETASYLVSLAYNVRRGFPFSTFGETALILAQNVVITVLVLKYGGHAGLAVMFIAVLAGATGALFTDTAVPMSTLTWLQAGAGGLGVASKVPQIVAIWREGGTGQLSAFTVFNYLVGSLTRIYTTLQEVDDKLILYGFVACFALNAVLAAQMMYYWTATPVVKTKTPQKFSVTAAEKSSSASATTTSANAAPMQATVRRGATTRRRGD